MTGAITWRELISQPDQWRSLARHTPSRTPLWDRVLVASQVIVFGSGSSYYLAMLVGDTIERLTKRRVIVAPSCEIMLDPERILGIDDGPRVGISFSRSGESSEALLATALLHERDIPVLGVTCSGISSLARAASEAMVVPEGEEEGMVMLRSFTCMLLAARGALGAEGQASLEHLAELGQSTLATHTNAITAVANARPFDRFVLLGSGGDHGLAQEASLKLQEMACVTTEPYYTLEYRHGPRATGDERTLAVMFAPARNDLGVPLVRDLTGQGLATLVIGGDVSAYASTATATVALGTDLTPALRQVLALLPAQVLAFATAQRTGQDPDVPRNLKPVVRF